MAKITTIIIEELNEKNWEQCANLELNEDQLDALPSNLVSIAELNFYPATKAFAIKNSHNKVIGFATYGVPVGEESPKLFRLMIDKSYQGQGYGKAALNKILAKIFEEYNSQRIRVCYQPNNLKLRAFYESSGFREKELLPSNRRESGKILAVLNRSDFSG